MGAQEAVVGLIWKVEQVVMVDGVLIVLATVVPGAFVLALP